MNESAAVKVTKSHLARNAYLYIRQSTMRQVSENQESTRRQYALRERAVGLGWRQDQVVVIDSDLGQSGASAADRQGFQQLVGEVGTGRAGIVLGLEVSRLARNCSDWHRLLEICALTDTLILDEDGLYDPSHYNDRLLLGLKGTMSEAELHMLRARMKGGLLSKARRGELKMRLPVGLVYDGNRIVLSPDAQVRESLRVFFDTFQRLGSACATIKFFNDSGLLFPSPGGRGIDTKEVVFRRLTLSKAVHVLHNPRYAGAFAYGRRRTRKMPDGRTRTTRVARDEWEVLLLDAHPGYVTWAEFERIQQRLAETAKAFGIENRSGTPREGPALLQGLALCGLCGARLAVRYHHRNGVLVPEYSCHARTMQHRDPPCQVIPGRDVDRAVGDLVLEAISPMALVMTLSVQDEIHSRMDQVDLLRRQQVERAAYEAERARGRYMEVDAANRLVAATLEADWNEKLRLLEETRERAEAERQADRSRFDEATRQRILALAEDFPAVWKDPRTRPQERKRMVALLIEDVTLVRDKEIAIHV